jgi:hypothetical protein
MARNGKIARLPRATRDELNRRLQEGESGVRLVIWLNGLTETQNVLQNDFGGRPISEQNLCEWKGGGHRDWLARQETLAQARELAADATELTEATDGRLTDHLATVLAARYAAALLGWNGEVTDDFRCKLRALRGLCQDVVELRRGDHSGARLDMERERLERDREKTEIEVLEHFKSWACNPKIREWIRQDAVSSEQREHRIREIFGIKPEIAEQTAINQAEANRAVPDESN